MTRGERKRALELFRAAALHERGPFRAYLPEGCKPDDWHVGDCNGFYVAAGMLRTEARAVAVGLTLMARELT